MACSARHACSKWPARHACPPHDPPPFQALEVLLLQAALWAVVGPLAALLAQHPARAFLPAAPPVEAAQQ